MSIKKTTAYAAKKNNRTQLLAAIQRSILTTGACSSGELYSLGYKNKLLMSDVKALVKQGVIGARCIIETSLDGYNTHTESHFEFFLEKPSLGVFEVWSDSMPRNTSAYRLERLYGKAFFVTTCTTA